MPPFGPLVPRLRELASEAEKEQEKLDTEMKEIEILLKQTSGELEKLQQRQSEANLKMRQLEANLEGFSRSDIRTALNGAHDAQLRLFMMNGQLEQLQSKYRALQRYHTQLEHLVSLANQVSATTEYAPVPTVVAPTVTPSHEALVHVIEAQELERQRLSRQMHDGPAQSLTNLILQAEIAERMFDSDPARARTELGNLKNAANSTFQRIRDFIFDLRPMMLDDLGLVPTLKRYVQTFEGKNHVPTSLATLSEASLSPHIEVTLFRGVQELLKNAAQHAHASRIQVTLDLQSDPIVVAVEDDGIGFDVQPVLAGVRQRGSSGIANLEKRIEMLGGNILITSATGRGTKARIEMPSS